MKRTLDSSAQSDKYPRQLAHPVRGKTEPIKNMQRQPPVRGEFTILRSAEQLFSGSEKPLRVTLQPTPIRISNARGRLRLVDSAEIRKLASDSAARIIDALSKRKV